MSLRLHVTGSPEQGSFARRPHGRVYAGPECNVEVQCPPDPLWSYPSQESASGKILPTLSINNGAAAYLKEVIPICAVEFTAQHTAALEISALIRTDTDHFDRASPAAPYGHQRRDRRV
jgi:hypothetical protein